MEDNKRITLVSRETYNALVKALQDIADRMAILAAHGKAPEINEQTLVASVDLLASL